MRGSAAARRCVVLAILFAAPRLSSATEIYYGSSTTFDAGATDYSAVARLDATRVVSAWNSTTSNAKASVGTVGGSPPSITWGTPADIQIAQAGELAVAGLTATTFVVAYLDDHATGGNARAIVGTSTGGSITFSSSVAAGAATIGTSPRGAVSVAATDSTHFVMTWSAATTQAGMAVVGTVPGTASCPGVVPCLGTVRQFSPQVDSAHVIGLTASRVLIGFDETSPAVAAREIGANILNGDWNGAFVGPVTFNNNRLHMSCTSTGDGVTGLCAYSDPSAIPANSVRVEYVSFNGTTLSMNGPFPQISNGETADFVSIARLDRTNYLVAWQSLTPAVRGHSVIIRLAAGGTTISTPCGAIAEFTANSAPYVSAAGLSPTMAAVVWADGASAPGTSRIGLTQDTVSYLSGFETGEATIVPEIVSLGAGGSFETVTVRNGSGLRSFKQTDAGDSTFFSQACASSTGDLSMRFSFLKTANPAANQRILQAVGGATNQWRLDLTTAGRLQFVADAAIGTINVSQGSNPGATSLNDNQWYTIAISYSSRPSGFLGNGSMQLWINGSATPEIGARHTLSGTDISTLHVSGPAAGFFFDDVYVTDGSGRPPSGQIVMLTPDGDVSTQFTPSAAVSHFSLVNETQTNAAGLDTTEVHSTTNAGQVERFTMTDPPAGSRFTPKFLWRRSKEGNGGASVAFRIREGGAAIDAIIPDTTIATNLANQPLLSGLSPSGKLWSATMMSGLEVGISKESGSNDVTLTWLGVMVDYGEIETSPTAVGVEGLEARGLDGAVLLHWRAVLPFPEGFEVRRTDGSGWVTVASGVRPDSLEDLGDCRFEDAGLEPGREYGYEIVSQAQTWGPVFATTTTLGSAASCGCSQIPTGATRVPPLALALGSTAVALWHRRHRRRACSSRDFR